MAVSRLLPLEKMKKKRWDEDNGLSSSPSNVATP